MIETRPDMQLTKAILYFYNFEKTKLLLSVMFVLENFCGNSNRQSSETLYFFTLTLQTHSLLGVKITAGPGGDNKCPSFYPTSEAWSAVGQDTFVFAQNQERGFNSKINNQLEFQSCMVSKSFTILKVVLRSTK